eukprot:TRINITY_DN754_c0_g1_i3.p1 TRINITY_DN754_c0_g1~~TRINITY_DN754_c0_g1_i3.p1  ORF type:complete len:704 (-),score=252.88 TRINITY_DN754_c0_g1_i3:158-2158(-)
MAVATKEEMTQTPTQKVITLLGNMKTKGLEEKEAEKTQFAEYKKFCYYTLKNKERSINELTEKIDMLNANIERNDASAATLKTEIAGHEKDLATATSDLDNATSVRKQEESDYKVALTDYEETIDAVGKAKEVMKAQSHNRAQADALLQLNIKASPKQAMAALMSFLQGQKSSKSSQPAAEGYEFQSQGIIDMLEELQTKFLAEMNDLKMQEQSKVSSFDLVRTALQHEIDQATSHSAKKTEFRESALSELQADKAALEQAIADKAADTKYSKDLNAECTKKASDFEARQTLRAEEIEAIEKATEIISTDTVSGASEKHMPGRFLQTGASALANLRTVSSKPHSKIQTALLLLERKAGLLGSRTLSLMASQVSAVAPADTEGDTAADEAMVKIKEMLQTLLLKLQKQAQDETTQKAYCDKELAANKMTRTTKTEEKDMLDAEIDQLTTSIAKLTNENAELNADITKMVEAMSEATRVRTEEKDTNRQTIKEAEAAKVAVAQAMGVLQDFYAKAAKATSLVQVPGQPDTEKPAIFDSEYKGMQGESGGVVQMLEVILEDFSRLITETNTDEKAAYDQYQKFTEDTKVDKGEKEVTIKHNEERITEQTTMKEQRENDLKATETELNAANKYYEQLHMQCLDANKAAEEARLQRQEEIESLEDAKAALS